MAILGTERSLLLPRCENYEISDLAALTDAGKQSWDLVVTPNLQHVRLLQRNQILAETYARARFVVPDGWPFVLLAKLVTGRRVRRVPGADILEWLLLVGQRTRRLIVVGSSESANRMFRARAEQLGWTTSAEPAPSYELEDDLLRAELVRRIAADSDGGYIVLGLGCPKQELLAAELSRQPGAGLVLCVGAAVDFSSGLKTRAPRLVRVSYVEWLYRMLHDPRRLTRRYASDGIFLCRAIVAVCRERILRWKTS